MIKQMLRLPLTIQNHKKIALSAMAGVILIIGGGVTTTVLLRPHVPKIDTPDVKAERDYNELVKTREAELAAAKAQVSLPTNEQPVFATVSNAKSLPNNDFFKEALNDDRILMYPKNKKVFLYRPSTKQVIAQAPLDYKVGVAATDSAQVAADVQTSESPTTAAFQKSGKVLIQPK